MTNNAQEESARTAGSTDAAIDASTAAGRTATPESAASPETPGRAHKRSVWPVTVALFALGVALAAAGYVWTQERTGMNLQLAEMRDEASGKSSRLDALGARLDEVASARSRLAEEVESLSARLTSEVERLETLPARFDRLEESVERFAGAGEQVRRAWLLAEAEHYMRIANAQIGLAGDIDVAQTALGLADDTLRELDDPRLIAVRKQIASELTALRAVPRPDIEGIVLDLASLSDAIESLPLKQTVPDEFRPARAPLADDLSGTDRAVAAVGEAFRSLVRVRRTDEPFTPLLPEAEKSLLVRSLDLELQLAQLAIMRRDAGMHRRALEAATLRLQRYFDVSSAEVQAAMTMLEELSRTELPDEIPDISASLAALERVTGASTGNGGDR